VAAFQAKVLDVGGACLAAPECVEPEEHCKRRVVSVVLFSGEQEDAELGAVQAPGIGWVNLWAADVLGRVRPDPPVDVSEPIGAAHRGKAPCRLLTRQGHERPSSNNELDMGASRLEHRYPVAGRPLEDAPQVVPLGVEGAAAVAGEVRRSGEPRTRRSETSAVRFVGTPVFWFRGLIRAHSLRTGVHSARGNSPTVPRSG
jgi:hypothetical protein